MPSAGEAYRWGLHVAALWPFPVVARGSRLRDPGEGEFASTWAAAAPYAERARSMPLAPAGERARVPQPHRNLRRDDKNGLAWRARFRRRQGDASGSEVECEAGGGGLDRRPTDRVIGGVTAADLIAMAASS